MCVCVCVNERKSVRERESVCNLNFFGICLPNSKFASWEQFATPKCVKAKLWNNNNTIVMFFFVKFFPVIVKLFVYILNKQLRPFLYD